MTPVDRLALGLDFGTESVRALLVDLTGTERASAVVKYPHGQITQTLPGTGEPLPPDFALQSPSDWLSASAQAVRKAMKTAGASPQNVVGMGVDFTSCTMLPCLRDGRPLCELDSFKARKYAWPKLWKHHGAITQTQKINQLAAQRKEPWLARYGGVIGLEWFFPKILETLEMAPQVYEAAQVWLEGGDWYVWQLVMTDPPDAATLPRSTCMAGYKAMWNAESGYPSPAFFNALDLRMEHVVRDKLPGKLLAPGQCAGRLNATMARKMGLLPGVPVSAAIIDAHAGVPGAGIAGPDTLVLVMGTSSCHMINARHEQVIPGVAGVVQGGILPGYYGYETGQAAVGDAFDWLRRLTGQKSFTGLDQKAAALPPGAQGVMCMDWFNGCRTPLMDGSLRGSFTGLHLSHQPQHLYRALLEASGFGLRWIAELLTQGGVPVKHFVATGGLPHHNPLLIQIYADILGKEVLVHPSTQGPALGAAILGVLAAGKEAGFSSPKAAIQAMAGATHDAKDPGRRWTVVKPDKNAGKAYEGLYQQYREWARTVQTIHG